LFRLNLVVFHCRFLRLLQAEDVWLVSVPVAAQQESFNDSRMLGDVVLESHPTSFLKSATILAYIAAVPLFGTGIFFEEPDSLVRLYRSHT